MNTNEIPAAFKVRLSIASERHSLNSSYKERGIKVNVDTKIRWLFRHGRAFLTRCKDPAALLEKDFDLYLKSSDGYIHLDLSLGIANYPDIQKDAELEFRDKTLPIPPPPPPTPPIIPLPPTPPPQPIIPLPPPPPPLPTLPIIPSPPTPPPQPIIPLPPTPPPQPIIPLPPPPPPLPTLPIIPSPPTPPPQPIIPLPPTPPPQPIIPLPPPPPPLPTLPIIPSPPTPPPQPIIPPSPTPPPQPIIPPSPTPPPSPKKDLPFSSIDYFGLNYRDVLKDYRLFHLVVMNRDKRSLLMNIKKPVKEVIANTCAIFGIPNAEEQHLWLPRGKQHIIQKYGGKPKKRIGKFLRRRRVAASSTPEMRLNANKTLEDQYNFNIKPLVLHLNHCHPHEDETDHLNTPYDEVDMGMEWPPQENRDVRTYRQFYQSWCGAVQEAYPIVKEDAIRLAALLTCYYHGDREEYKSWPPEDYDVKAFLPEAYCKTFGIAGDVEKAYCRLSGMTSQECMVEASELCSKKTTHQGIFFEVSVPGKRDVLSVIRWKKMRPQLFGLSSHGVFRVDKDSGQIQFTHRFSDIRHWNCRENRVRGEYTLRLNFSQWSKEYHAYTYQQEEILDTLQLYIDMTRHGIISQAPSRPTSALIEKEREIEKIDLAQYSPESSLDTFRAENPPQLGDLEDSVETPGTREVIVSAV